MEKVIQYIYETTVNKTVTEKVSEEREENGKKITVSKDVEVIKPVKLALLKPNRKKFKEADIYYAKKLSYYLSIGIMPYSLVNKRYLNDGGVLSEDTKTAVKKFREILVELHTEYFGIKQPLTEETTKRRSELINEIESVNKILNNFENSYASLFDNTAEIKTKNDTLEWWITTLSLIDEDGKGYVPFFGRGNEEERMKKLEDLEELDNEFINDFIKKASYFVSFWYNSGANLTKEDYESAEKHYSLQVENIKSPEVKIVPPIPEPVTPVS